MARSMLPRGVLRRLWFMPFITCVLGTTAHAVRAADASSPPDSPLPATASDATATAHAPASTDQGASEGRKSSGILLGGGLGGAIPGGEVSDGVHFGDLVSAFTLGRLDAGYRFNEHFLFGAYVEGGTGAINTSDALAICDADGVDCSAGLVRLGVQARAYLSTQSRLQPWGGAGFGYEWFSFSARDEVYDDSVTVLAKGAERLRFDFSHGQKVTPEEMKKVEDLVNEAIKADFPIHCEQLSVDEAKGKGAIGLFEDKYAQMGGKINVYFMGDFSNEICGGPHVEHTGQLGSFKIQKEEAVSAGVRRIKATVTGT